MSEWVWPESVVTNVVDGDTFDALVTRDIGFNGIVTFPIRLRLARINTQPVTSSAGQRARERVLEVAEEPVHITTLKPYKYGGPPSATGQWMAEVDLPDGTNVSDMLVDEGLAVYWDGTGPRPDN